MQPRLKVVVQVGLDVHIAKLQVQEKTALFLKMDLSSLCSLIGIGKKGVGNHRTVVPWHGPTFIEDCLITASGREEEGGYPGQNYHLFMKESQK